MSIHILETYLPHNCLPFLKKWFANHVIHIKITKNRNSKLGDYRKLPDNSHQISINSTLEPQLFFFVLTHELAHLIAFDDYKRIAAHGKEWKLVFGTMLLESIAIYDDELQAILVKFSKNPKANFMSSYDLVRYFHHKNLTPEDYFLENLSIGTQFIYKQERYTIEEIRKKLYLCTHFTNGEKYLFKPLTKVQKAEKYEQ